MPLTEKEMLEQFYAEQRLARRWALAAFFSFVVLLTVVVLYYCL